MYATPMRDETTGLFESLAESIATVRAAADAGMEGARLQVSHLKCGSGAVWGRAAEAIALLEAARAEGLDVAADQYPYTAAATTLATILPPALQGLGVDACVSALVDPHVRDLVRSEIERGISGWENVASDPGWGGLRISYAASRPEWAGRSLAELADEEHEDPADLAFDALVADRLDVSVVIECMSEPDVETIVAVPWVSVCTDATGRRPGHPILDAGRPHPRTYGSTARVLGRYARERGTLPLETAVAKLTSVPAARLGLRDRGIVREGAMADLVVFDPATIADEATYSDPARYPRGIDHVIVNGRAAILDGAETGERPGRLLRRP
jgi:dihydroorotase/N-acyl-D-amino-acid deacylase